MNKETRLIYSVFKQLVKDLEYRIKNDWDNIIANEDFICWSCHSERPWTQQEIDNAKKEGDELDPTCKTLDKQLEIRFKNLGQYERDRGRKEAKNQYVFDIETHVNNETHNVTLGLAWWDFLRPSVLRALWLIKRTYRKALSHEMANIDVRLALISPNRIDQILLGDKGEQKDE